MIECHLCHRVITPDGKYRLVCAGIVQCLPTCMTHTDLRARSATHINSQAGEPRTGNGCLRPADKEQVDGE